MSEPRRHPGQRGASLTACLAVVVALLLSPRPAAAAVGCFDASFSGESAFLTLQPGDTGQFSVMFQNTGSCTWVKDAATQVNLAQGLPLNSPSPYSCWASGWLSATAYATTPQTIPPGAIATFTYAVKVPANVPPGTYRFDGDLVVAATGQALNPQGYHQDIAVAQPSGAILGGKVTAEATGAPVSNVSVQVYRSSAVLTGSSVPFTSSSTDDCGYYTVGRVSPLPAGSYRIGFIPPAGANLFLKYYPNVYQVFAGADVNVSNGTTRIDIALSPIRTITGSAKSAAGGGVQNTAVSVYDANAPCTIPQNSCGQIADAITTATGAFTALVPPGDFSVLFMPPAGLGFDNEFWKNLSAPPFTIVSTRNGNATGIDLVFRPTISGRVSAPSGSPLNESVPVRAFVASGGTCVQVAISYAHPFKNGTYAIALNAAPPTTYYVDVEPYSGSTLPTKWWQNATSCASATPIIWTGTSVGGINITLP